MRKLSIVFFLLLVFLAVLAGMLGWIVKTESGLRFALQKAGQVMGPDSSQQLQFGPVKGNLWDGAELESLSWRQGDKSASIQNLQLRADWSKLWQRTLLIQGLTARSVQLDFPPDEDDTEPFLLPEKIQLPVDVELQELRIDQLVVNSLEFTDLSGKVSVNEGRLDIEHLAAQVQGTELQTRLGMLLEKPYALNGYVTAQRTFEDVLLNAKLEAQGSLERLELKLNALGSSGNGNEISQSVEAQGVVTPFQAGLVENVSLFASGFDPSLWLDGAPKASLTVQANIQPNADFSQSVGDISVRNARPLKLHEGGVPVASLKARFDMALKEQQPQQFDLRIDELKLMHGKRDSGGLKGVLKWLAATVPENGSAPADLAAGDVSFDIQTSSLDASVFADIPRSTALNANIQGKKSGNLVNVSSLEIRDRSALIKGKVIAGLAGKLPLDLQLQLASVNPGNYIPGSNPLLQGNLNGDVYFKGELAAAGQAKGVDPFGELRVALENSSLAGAPLTLKAKAMGGTSRLNSLLIDLDVVGNTAFASGSYGTPNDSIDLDVNLDELKRLGQLVKLKLDGTARVKAKVRGVQGNLSGAGNIDVRQLRLDSQLQVERVSGDFNLGSSPASPWTGDILVSKVKVPGAASNLLNDMTLVLRGARGQHELKGVFSSGLQPFSRQRPIKGQFALSGGMKKAWQGAITQLQLEGMWLPARSFSLQKPAPLTLAAGNVELRDLEIKGEDTSLIRNRLLKVANREIRIEGEMPQFAFPRLSPILRRQVTVEPRDLIARVKWNYLANANVVDGHVDLKHVSGGLQILADAQTDVNIQDMTVRLDFNRTAANLDLNILAEQFGRLTGNLSLPVFQNPETKSWGLAGNKPMQGSIAAAFTELSWLGPLINTGIRTSGTGQVAVAIGGTVDKPDVQGRLFAMGLDVFQIDQGVRLEDGNVVVDFTTDKATIDTFEFTVYNRTVPRRRIEELGPLIQGSGKISATGEWNLTGLNGEIKVNLDRVPLLQRPDRWLMVNSTASITQPSREGQALRIRGEVNALGAYFEMPEKGPQTLSDDVFIQGRSEVAGNGMPIDFQLQANLGERFYINAEGLRSRLTGGVRLVMLEGVGGSGQRRAGRRLTATGSIQTAEGTYRAYGQDLTIERGVVNFQGPLENPGLNIRAVRKGVAVEAGVEVTGTAQRPRVTLVSDPAVPDAEKLSWMIIGRGSNSADRDSTLLLTAAAAIFGNEDESTTRKIARRLGIDDLTLSTGSLTAADSRAVGSKVAVAPGADASANIIGSDDPLLSQRIISIGKRLSDRIYLSLDQSVTTAANIVKLNYQYSRQLSFIARAGADNAVDVLYQFSFD